MRTPTTSAAVAAQLIRADRQRLLNLVVGLPEERLRAPYGVADGPLGHFCDSLHDLVAHIAMWDEITLAVLREDAAGRRHWSLEAAWETAEAGSALNIGGVEAGRHVSSALLVERLATVVDALVAEITAYDEAAWQGQAAAEDFDGSVGALAEYAASPPGGLPYGHVAKHLGAIEEVVDPRFGPETDALLARFAAAPQDDETDQYKALLRDREELPDPELAGVTHPAARVTDLQLELPGRTLQARLYRPETDEPRPVLLWLHGGEFIGGDLRDIEYAASGIAVRGDVVVVSLSYRLAPENPYPAGLEDVVDTLTWLRENVDERTLVGGQSAGAALAAGACLRAAALGLPMPERQVLCYPSLDFDQDTESARLFDGVFLSTKPGWADEVYFPPGELPATAVPLRADDLSRQPPALILAAGRDPLRDDARGYATRLAQAGVPVRLVEYADTMHAFLNFPAALSAGRRAVELIGDDLRAAVR
ncbi:alpha/beta hydrolase fold domain-containing protein [Kribbella italica]|uniref:Acetyl esterase/lipase n=1 Tax=Kribbella italica TaxID=1540520 RepID=A0A7W9JB99_9ACTN|nr:alpha/beta hydrolase fold domain-containing protein [Kribbella italica]MBB5838790.1 acetyl esterase/lipase [Kribbella italica]